MEKILSERKCSYCQTVKPIEMFSKNRTMPGGYSYECKPCHKQRGKALYARDGSVQKVHGYKVVDKKFGRDNDIDRETFLQMLIDYPTCYFCECPNNLGLDRIDTTLGHLKTNCLIACSACNITRSRFPGATHKDFKRIMGQSLKELRTHCGNYL